MASVFQWQASDFVNDMLIMSRADADICFMTLSKDYRDDRLAVPFVKCSVFLVLHTRNVEFQQWLSGCKKMDAEEHDSEH